MRFRRLVEFVAVVAILGYRAAASPQERPEQAVSAAEDPLTSRLQYILGPGDEIVIVAINADEIANKPTRISSSGDINLPMVGRIQAAGMTIIQLESELTERLKVYIRQPDLSVNVTQFRSQPVSVIGAVGNPGVVQLEGQKTLIQVLSQAGGLRQDAAPRISITRRKEWGPIPLNSAKADATGNHSVAEVSYLSILDASHAEQNIQILPYDIISVPRADLVYVIGSVNKPGGFTLNEKEAISVLQALALAQGTTPTAAEQNSKIIRPVPGSSRIEIAINVKDLRRGKIKDMMLQPEDILLIPDSYAKGTLRRTLETAVQATTGLIIYRR